MLGRATPIYDSSGFGLSPAPHPAAQQFLREKSRRAPYCQRFRVFRGTRQFYENVNSAPHRISSRSLGMDEASDRSRFPQPFSANKKREPEQPMASPRSTASIVQHYF